MREIWKLRGLTVLAALAALLIAAPACNHSGEIRAPHTAEASTPTRAAIAIVKRAPVVSSFSIAGEFLPYQEVELHAKVSGYVRKISVDIGDRVRAGQTLATLEVPELNAQVTGAEAGVRHSQQEIQRAQNEVVRAEAAHQALHAAYRRLKQAAEARPGLIAEQELDDAEAKDRTSEAQVDVAKAGLSAATQQLDMSKATHQQVAAMQDYSHIVAPFDGVVTWRYADTGSLIQAGTSNSSSMPVVKVAQVNVLRLRVPVPETVSESIHIGDTAEVRVQATGEKFAGTIARFTNSLDRSTRTMQVEIDVPNKDYKLYPGMYADVTFAVRQHGEPLTVPVTALNRGENGQASVLVVDSLNKVERRTIQTGAEDPNNIEVISGLRDGERVVVGNLSAYQPGQVVEPKPSRVATAAWSEAGGDQ
ncbi:MAG TPA: efflux RND transporter periplasmic adaptor subunit [candidate division Zixibacteria bacterium]|nr:efflux RND transporter periplasmic adaptor subunit [candidate division Zixibacteria bacterium]